MGLQNQSKAVKDGTFGRMLIRRVAVNRRQLDNTKVFVKSDWRVLSSGLCQNPKTSNKPHRAAACSRLLTEHPCVIPGREYFTWVPCLFQVKRSLSPGNRPLSQCTGFQNAHRFLKNVGENIKKWCSPPSDTAQERLPGDPAELYSFSSKLSKRAPAPLRTSCGALEVIFPFTGATTFQLPHTKPSVAQKESRTDY